MAKTLAYNSTFRLYSNKTAAYWCWRVSACLRVVCAPTEKSCNAFPVSTSTVESWLQPKLTQSVFVAH